MATRTAPPRKAKAAVVQPARRPPVVAVPAGPAPAPRAAREPVWLVRIVLVLFLVGFAAFLAREARGLLDAVEVTRGVLYWSGLGLGVLLGSAAGALGTAAVLRARKP